MNTKNSLVEQDAESPNPAKRQATHSHLQWGAFDESGKLRAILESESEAYFYVRNRGHMYNGTHRKIETPKPFIILGHNENKIYDSRDAI